MTDDSLNAETPPGMPRWVKLLVLLVILVSLLVVVILFIVGGGHGPGRHAPGMLAGFVLLAGRHDSTLSVLRGGITPDVVIPSEGGHE
jgi:hypothetical protein